MRLTKDLVSPFINSYIVDYPTPWNFENDDSWSLEEAAVICLVIHIVSGILYVIVFYAPPLYLLFLDIDSYIEGLEFLNFCVFKNLRDGWLIRYLHANGASMFFIVVYCHIFRGLFYGSYMFPRERLWVNCLVIFLMIIIFVDSFALEWYVKIAPFGIITLRDVFPFLVTGLVFIHWGSYYLQGYNNPLGIDPRVQTISFYPFFYAKELYSFFVLVFFLSLFVVYYPNIISHPASYVPSNPTATIPAWYFLPFYAILHSIPDKLGGILALFSAIIVLMILPFLNTSQVRSGSYKPRYAITYWFFLIDFIILGWVGQTPLQTPFIEIGMLATVYYFFFLLILLPAIGYIESKLASIKSYTPKFGPKEFIIDE